MKPLEGKIIISTRLPEHATSIAAPLEEKGAVVYNMPMISITGMQISSQLVNILNSLDAFNWIIFTSQHGVIYFFQLLETIAKSTNLPKKLKIAAYGRKAEEALNKRNMSPTYVSEANTSSIFFKELADKVLQPNEHVLLPLGNLAKNTYNQYLKNLVFYQRINVYQNSCPTTADNEILKRIQEGRYDIIIFTSPSTFYNLGNFLDLDTINNKLKAASIGPGTTAALEENDVRPGRASSSSVEALIKDIIQYFNSNNNT